MFGGFNPFQAISGVLSPTSTDDPSKMAYRSAAMQLLAGGDPSKVMMNMPAIMMEAKAAKRKEELDKRRLAVDEASLADQEQRTRLLKQQELRELEKQESARKFGEAFERYNLDPQTVAAPEDHGDGTVSVGKTDRAVPTGEEGNIYSQQIMALPLTLRQAIADGSLAASDELQTAMGKGMQEVFDPSAKGIDSEVITLMNPETREVQSFDMKDQRQNLMGRSAMSKGWVQTSPAQTVKTVQTAAPWETVENDEVKNIVTEQQANNEMNNQVQDIGTLLLSDDLYTGVGGEVVNSALRAGQDWFGWFKDIDLSKPQAIEKMQAEMVFGAKKNFMSGDKTFSNSDRDFLKNMIVGITNDKPGIARMMAMQQLKSDWATQKREFVQGYNQQNSGSTVGQALKAWEEQAKALRPQIFNEQNVQKLMRGYLAGTKDRSLMEYARDRASSARKQGLPVNPTEMLGAPPAASAPTGTGQGSWVKGDDGVWRKQ